MLRLKIRRIIPNVWNLKNIAELARPILPIKKLNNFSTPGSVVILSAWSKFERKDV